MGIKVLLMVKCYSIMWFMSGGGIRKGKDAGSRVNGSIIDQSEQEL